MIVFISYSTENQPLADALRRTLEALHTACSVHVMQNIPFGADWSKEIKARLDEADVLIAIAGNTVRKEFAFTGVEVGFFDRSLQEKPKGTNGATRLLIPVYLSGYPPDALKSTQGPNLHDYIVRLDGFDMGKPTEEIARSLDIKEDDPAYRLFATLEAIATPGQAIAPARATLLQDKAREFYLTAIQIVRAQPVEEQLPKGKFIVHLPANAWDLAEAQIEVEGPLVQLLSLDSRKARTWEQVAAGFPKNGAAPDEWREGIQALLRTTRNGNLDEGDQLVTSLGDSDTGQVRLFVSRAVRYYDGRRDIHIYAIKLLRERDYGDRFTTTLWKGLGSGIRLRFLLLEDVDFSESVIRVELDKGADHLKAKALELKTELYAAERLWRVAELDDTRNLVRILGSEQATLVTEMTKTWRERRDALVQALCAVLAADDDKLMGPTGEWIKAIQDLRRCTSAFNAQLLSHMLGLLKAAVEEAMKDDPPAREHAAGAVTAAES